MADEVYGDAQLALLYDLIYPPACAPGFGFYLSLVMAARDVLDAGCGTGALLHEARRRGHRGHLCGLDPAAAMLAQAQRRTDIEWRRADLASAPWIEEFDLVVMTGHAFQVLVEDHELGAALAAVHRALRPGGRFAFETRNPAARAWEGWAGEVTEFVAGGGATVRRMRELESNFDGRSVTFTETFSSPRWDRARVSRSTLRFLDVAGLGEFLTRAGLVIEEQYGGFGGEPLAPASPEIVTIARRDRSGP